MMCYSTINKLDIIVSLKLSISSCRRSILMIVPLNGTQIGAISLVTYVDILYAYCDNSCNSKLNYSILNMVSINYSNYMMLLAQNK